MVNGFIILRTSNATRLLIVKKYYLKTRIYTKGNVEHQSPVNINSLISFMNKSRLEDKLSLRFFK